MGIIIGIDHGNGLMKTANSYFRTGVAEFDSKPPMETKRTVYWNEKYYVCDSGYGSLKRDKTQDETYWYLTLCAMGERLSFLKTKIDLKNGTDVVLAVGLPLTYQDDEKKRFVKYLKRGQVDFKYNGKHFLLNIKEIVLCPQGCSAVATQIREWHNEPVVNSVDIGSGTIDIQAYNYGVPSQERSLTIENIGVTRCIRNIIEIVQRKTRKTLVREQIEAVLWPRGKVMIAPEIKTEITTCAKEYVNMLISQVMENGIDVSAQPAVFVGGGASLVRKYCNKSLLAYPIYKDDVCENAKGYEFIAENKLKRKSTK